jgi:hypothetical protein
MMLAPIIRSQNLRTVFPHSNGDQEEGYVLIGIDIFEQHPSIQFFYG